MFTQHKRWQPMLGCQKQVLKLFQAVLHGCVAMFSQIYRNAFKYIENEKFAIDAQQSHLESKFQKIYS